ncbi:MAG: GNAT family N-acetyltransferase [Rhodoglobus sp.]
MFTIDEIAIPATLDDPAAADFIRAIEVGNEVEAIGYGTADLAYTPAEELVGYDNPHEPHRTLVARVDGVIVGRALYETHIGEEADTAWIAVEVLPAFRGSGIGTALADAVEAIARADGKAKTIVYAPIQDEAGERLASPTGFGSISVTREVRFLRARGYSFEQVERLSQLPLPVADLDDRLAAAVAASGEDYVVHTWTGSTPERWLADRAVLATRMSTDAPSAGLEEPEDVWTVERVIDSDARNETNPRSRFTAAIEHRPTGALVGYTMLSVPPEKSRAVDQWATLVLKEHRGHALGMLLKVANLVHLRDGAPGHPSVVTFNAEENRHMLSVNEAVGFVGIANESAWRLDL